MPRPGGSRSSSSSRHYSSWLGGAEPPSWYISTTPPSVIALAGVSSSSTRCCRLGLDWDAAALAGGSMLDWAMLPPRSSPPSCLAASNPQNQSGASMPGSIAAATRKPRSASCAVPTAHTVPLYHLCSMSHTEAAQAHRWLRPPQQTPPPPRASPAEGGGCDLAAASPVLPYGRGALGLPATELRRRLHMRHAATVVKC